MIAKKISVLLIALAAALVFTVCAAAEDATVLPLGVDFSMDYATVLEKVGNDAVEDDLGDETGTIMLGKCGLGVADIEVENISFQIDRNNSEQASRLCQILASLPTGDACVADFRAALAALTAVYGEPDNDPFSDEAAMAYVEYGNLYATWTKPDVRINLNMSRMHYDSLSLDFTNRLCYNLDDLK